MNSLSMQRAFVISFLSFFLISCQIKQPVAPDRVIVEDLGLHNINQQNKAINSAIVKLEIGQTKQAERIIAQVLNINSTHKTANLLKKQLTNSYDVIFKTKRTINYQIKSGDSLGKIAKKWLGNPLYFVSLAKLNNIENPAKIQPHGLIKIPVLNDSSLAKKEKRRSQANIALLKKYTAEKKFLKSLQRMTNIYLVKDDHGKLLQLQNDTLEQFAGSKVSVTERYKMIEQVESINKNSKQQFLKKQFNQFIRDQKRSLLLDEFVLLFEAASYEKSAKTLIEAKKTELETYSQTNYFAIEKSLINKLHEQAILLRKNQKLQEANDSWELILKIQPDNKLASKYQERTARLLERLNSL